MKNDIWKEIPGYESIYAVSDLGNVMRMERITKHRFGGPMKLKERRKKVFINKGGYPAVTLYKEGKGVTHEVHRLVMLAFVGPPKDNEEVMHLENVQVNQDSSLSNLRYGSHMCNHAFQIDDGTIANGEKNGISKLTNNDVISIRYLYFNFGYKQKELAETFNVTQPNVSAIVNNKIWFHL